MEGSSGMCLGNCHVFVYWDQREGRVRTRGALTSFLPLPNPSSCSSTPIPRKFSEFPDFSDSFAHLPLTSRFYSFCFFHTPVIPSLPPTPLSLPLYCLSHICFPFFFFFYGSHSTCLVGYGIYLTHTGPPSQGLNLQSPYQGISSTFLYLPLCLLHVLILPTSWSSS